MTRVFFKRIKIFFKGVFLVKTDNIAPEVPLTLKEALFERLRLEKRFYLDQEKYSEFEITMKKMISDIECKQRLLNEELYEVLNIFSSNVVKGVQASDSEMILGEKENRRKCNELEVHKKELVCKLNAAERSYHAKCAEIDRVIEWYNTRNFDNLDDEYVLGIKGWNNLKELVDSITPADEGELNASPQQAIGRREKVRNGISSLVNSIFNFKKV